MKKLYNKALMFQSFYMGKWALLLSCFFFGFVCYESTSNNLRNVRNYISSLHGNSYIVHNYDVRLVSWGVLVFMYIIITGINKRNNMIFLTSGPYTKSEVKKNEILFLFISLCAFISVFIYVSICIYYREAALISISHGFVRETLKEVVRIFICGIAFISYLSIMDCLFANIGITVFLMIATPFLIVYDLMLFESSLEDLKCTIIYKNPVIEFVSNTINNVLDFVFNSINYDRYNTYVVIALILIGTVILLSVTSYTVKRLAINNTNKFFNFPIVEKLFVWCASISIVLLITYIIIETYTNGSRSYYSEVATYSYNGVIYIAIVFIASYILKRIISKQLKKII